MNDAKRAAALVLLTALFLLTATPAAALFGMGEEAAVPAGASAEAAPGAAAQGGAADAASAPGLAMRPVMWYDIPALISKSARL